MLDNIVYAEKDENTYYPFEGSDIVVYCDGEAKIFSDVIKMIVDGIKGEITLTVPLYDKVELTQFQGLYNKTFIEVISNEYGDHIVTIYHDVNYIGVRKIRNIDLTLFDEYVYKYTYSETFSWSKGMSIREKLESLGYPIK